MLAICLTFKLFADGVKFTNIHGWDLEGSGKLYEVALARMQIGTAITHAILFNQCFWNTQVRNCVIHFLMICLVIALHVIGKRHRKTKLESIVRIIDRMPFQVPSSRDRANWVYRYSHPYFRAKGVKETFRLMNQINSPLNMEARLFNRMREPKRFNMPFTVESPTKHSGDSPVNQYEGVEGSELPGHNGQTAPSMTNNHHQQVNVEPQHQFGSNHMPALNFNPAKSVLVNIEPPPNSERKSMPNSPEFIPVSPRLQNLPQPQPEENPSIQASHFRKDSVDLDPFMDCNSEDSDFELEDPIPMPKIRIPNQGPVNNRRLSRVPEAKPDTDIPIADIEAGEVGDMDVAEERSGKYVPKSATKTPIKSKMHMYARENYLAPIGVDEVHLGSKAKSDQNLVNEVPNSQTRLLNQRSRSNSKVNKTPEINPSAKIQRKKTRGHSGMESNSNSDFNELRESKGFLLPGVRRLSEHEVMLPHDGKATNPGDRNGAGLDNTTHN